MRTSTLPWRLAAAACVVLYSGFISAQKEPTVNVALRTSFDAAPFLVELLETAALENSTSYFPLLDRIADGAFSDLQTEKELYDRFIEVLQDDGHISTPESLSSFKFALALHAAAPRIEAHFQFYKTAIEPRMMASQDAACPVWVYLDGKQYCSPSLQRPQQPLDMGDSDMDLPFDRVLGPSTDSVPSILYADITHPLFGQFHRTVSQTARTGKTSYQVRYRPRINSAPKPLHVGGYGVELVLKRTDYIVIDDTSESEPEQEADQKPTDLKPLTTSELAGLGLNTASYILSSSDPLEFLLDISSKFPTYSSVIAAHNTSKDFLAEHRANRATFLPAGYNILWMNGQQIEPRYINAYSLLDTLRRERQLIGQLKDIGLSATEAVELLSHDVLAQAQAEDEPQRYDWRDETEGGHVIMWLNDIEQDKRYTGWPTSLHTLLQRTYPGQLPQVRRDIHNLIVPLDLGNIKDLDLVVNALQGLVKRAAPIRIGLVPYGKSPDAVSNAKLSFYLLETYGLSALMSFFQQVVVSKKGMSAVESAFASATVDRTTRGDAPVLTYAEVLASDRLGARLAAADAYGRRLAIRGPVPPFFINGVALQRSENWFDAMSQRIYIDLRAVQRAVYEEVLPEETWVPNFFLFQAVPRRNALVIPSDVSAIRVVDVASLVSDFSESFAALPRVPGGESALASERAHVLLVADFDSEEGRYLLYEAMVFRKSRSEVELVMLHNPGRAQVSSSLSAHLFALSQGGEPELDEGSLETVLQKGEASSDLADQSLEFWTSQQHLVERLRLLPGTNGVWLNGRLVELDAEPFLAEDFESLLDFELSQRIAPVTTAITALGLEDKFQRPLDVAKVTSLVARSLKSDLPEGIFETAPLIRMNKHELWEDEHSTIHLPASGEPTIQMVAVIDPATEIVQQWVPLLKILSELAGVDVKIYLNPQERLTELPIKRFYQQVVSSAPSFGGIL